MVIDNHLGIREVSRMAVARREENLYDYILVSDEGKYKGIISIASLLQATSVF